MAQVIAPFFSIAASGSVCNITASKRTQHRAKGRNPRGHNHIMRIKKKKPKKVPTAAQLIQRAKIKAATKAWKALDATAQAVWKAKGVTVRFANDRGLGYVLPHGYVLFVREYIAQNIAAPALPLLPA